MKERGKLGLIVFQFPPWFRYSKKSLEEILKTRELMSGFDMAVEFRHGSWLLEKNRKDLFSILSREGITYVTADEPQYGTLDTIPYIPEATTETAYIRLHGRNRENWLKRGIATSLRYDYLYSEKELRELLPSIRRLAEKTRKTFVMFNNCHGASAVKNALQMMELLNQ
ncbi:MAG: DUF72 domain-containing protein [Nitrospirae bacterium]|nr:MAG: DUF72 domain-containing protein [Nitrospirota bacterium]